jgi:hypothetical protein
MIDYFLHNNLLGSITSLMVLILLQKINYLKSCIINYANFIFEYLYYTSSSNTKPFYFINNGPLKKFDMFLKNYPFILISSLLLSCDNSAGKILIRKASSNCISIPYQLPIEIDSAVSYLDSEIIIRNIAHEKLRLLKEKNLELLKPQREKYEKEAETVYLVNTSQSDIISYTVKQTIDDIYQTSTTSIFKLNPGEEIPIGCSLIVNEEMQVQKQTYKIVGYTKSIK